MKQWTIALIPLVIISLFSAFFGCKELYNHNGISGIKPLYHKEAVAFFREFEANEERANTLYTDKVISVKGRIIQVIQDDSIQSVLLGEEPEANGVLCQLEPRQTSAGELKPGLVIEIKGVCTGLLMDVVLVRCVRESQGPRRFDMFRRPN